MTEDQRFARVLIDFDDVGGFQAHQQFALSTATDRSNANHISWRYIEFNRLLFGHFEIPDFQRFQFS